MNEMSINNQTQIGLFKLSDLNTSLPSKNFRLTETLEHISHFLGIQSKKVEHKERPVLLTLIENSLGHPILTSTPATQSWLLKKIELMFFHKSLT